MVASMRGRPKRDRQEGLAALSLQNRTPFGINVRIAHGPA